MRDTFSGQLASSLRTDFRSLLYGVAVLLVTGQDSTMRIFSTVHDKHNKSLGRASFNKTETKRTGLKHDQHKMPPVTVFAAGRSAVCVCVCVCVCFCVCVCVYVCVSMSMSTCKLQSDSAGKHVLVALSKGDGKWGGGDGDKRRKTWGGG